MSLLVVTVLGDLGQASIPKIVIGYLRFYADVPSDFIDDHGVEIGVGEALVSLVLACRNLPAPFY